MPYQFISLLGLIQEGIKATTDSQILTIAPPVVLSKSKTFNLVNALHFLKRYGVDLIEEHKPTKTEREQAEGFYHEYEEYRAKHQPGDEYELLQTWAEDMYLQNYFSLIEESDYRAHSDLIERLCADAQVDMPAAPVDAKMQTFTDAHQGKDINMSVTRFMVEALRYYKNLSPEEIGVASGKGKNSTFRNSVDLTHELRNVITRLSAFFCDIAKKPSSANTSNFTNFSGCLL
jgi:hypothetical protein